MARLPTSKISRICIYWKVECWKIFADQCDGQPERPCKNITDPRKNAADQYFSHQWGMVSCDLPGYGYAKVSKSTRKDFEKLITNYILNRRNLVNLFVLIDIRHNPQKIDLDFMQWCGESSIPFSIVFTKSDKMKPNAAKKNIEEYRSELLKIWEELPQIFVTSAEKKEGTEKILHYIEQTNDYLKKNKVTFDD